MTPERSIEIQGLLDPDIQMQLDECVALPAKPKEIERAMELSLRWAERCKTAFGEQAGKAMFGIVQGGDVAGAAHPLGAGAEGDGPQGLFDRRAGGRRAAGGDAGDARHHLSRTAGGKAALPDGRRHARRYTEIGGARHRHVRLRDADQGRAPRPRLYPARQDQPAQRLAMPTIRARSTRRSDCPAARDYSRAYLHHLVKSQEALGAMLLTWNNLSYYQRLMHDIRDAIEAQAFADRAAEITEGWARETCASLSRLPAANVFETTVG